MNQYVGTVPSTFQLLYHFCLCFMFILQDVGPWKREPSIFSQFCFVHVLEKKAPTICDTKLVKQQFMILIYPQNWINKPYHPIKKIQGAPFFVLSKTHFKFQQKQPNAFCSSEFLSRPRNLVGHSIPLGQNDHCSSTSFFDGSRNVAHPDAAPRTRRRPWIRWYVRLEGDDLYLQSYDPGGI